MGNKYIFSAINHREDRSLRIAPAAARGARGGSAALSAEDEECGTGGRGAACGTALRAAFAFRGAAGAPRGVGTAGEERSAAGGLCVRRAGAVRDAEGPGEAGGGGGAEGGGGGGIAALVGAVHARRGSGDTAPLGEALAAGPRRCGEQRVRGGERPRVSRGGGAFVPRGPNKGAAGPGREGRLPALSLVLAEPPGGAARARGESVPRRGGRGRKAGPGRARLWEGLRSGSALSAVPLFRLGPRKRNPEHPSPQVRLRPGVQ